MAVAAGGATELNFRTLFFLFPSRMWERRRARSNMYDLLSRLRSTRNLWANECWMDPQLHSTFLYPKFIPHNSCTFNPIGKCSIPSFGFKRFLVCTFDRDKAQHIVNQRVKGKEEKGIMSRGSKELQKCVRRERVRRGYSVLKQIP